VQGERFLLPLAELPLAGLHNAANAMAALALCAALGFDAEALLPALRRFRGLPHRVEKVAEIGGVTWYDDSKGTNVGATVAALSGLGGINATASASSSWGVTARHRNFSPLQRRRGEACPRRDPDRPRRAGDRPGHRRLPACRSKPPPTWRMPCAAPPTLAQSAGDAALLSPACASFDMFRNYEHRAQVFIAAVKALEQGR
jgi:UDP-N-acetylmuramoylalanine--D-glutamate ligase